MFAFAESLKSFLYFKVKEELLPSCASIEELKRILELRLRVVVPVDNFPAKVEVPVPLIIKVEEPYIISFAQIGIVVVGVNAKAP